ncbi:MAG TPA: O-antigen ligase family protein [Xanthomonadaceae bacterium]|nr:O-antigen ligase family protein [Xanthomonadaceae bacterium]
MVDRIGQLAPALLWLAVLALLPFPAVAELALLAGALLGVLAALRGRVPWRAPELTIVHLAFLGFWLPELVSAFDALDASRAWREAGADLRYLPFLWFAHAAFAERGSRALALRGVTIMVLAFALDGLVQAATGAGLAGATAPDRLSGVFGAHDLKLGPVLAVLSPIALLVLQRRAGLPGLVLGFALLAPVVLLAGTRAAWLVFALALAGVLWHCYGPRRAAGFLLLGVAALGAIGGGLYLGSARFAERVDRTAAAFGGDLAGLDHALAGRIAIWQAATAMALEHPFNGVGVRGFRNAYPAYAAVDDRWLSAGQTAMHPHQLVLEVAAETGAFGLLCWLGAAVAVLARLRRLPAAARRSAHAPLLALAVLLFPINTHPALYSSFWSLLLFALLGLLAGTLRGARQDAR